MPAFAMLSMPTPDAPANRPSVARLADFTLSVTPRLANFGHARQNLPRAWTKVV